MTNINLFAVTDSKEQYDKFIKLATEDYTELKNQIKNHFQPGQEEGLREYKVNILAEHAYKEYDINIISNLFFGIFLPAIMVYITTTLTINFQVENNTLASALIGIVVGVLFVFGAIYYLDRYSKNYKKRKKSISLNKAILFLENYEV
ncbi:hypothetical protein HMPREF9381_1855 [Streptococcus sanguinis SK72]|uniref:Uncharacterized protein n=1 Tax=Streptococcus sanguinis SK72 TaxID=888809 RepID=F0I3W5_STRSA|nr:hypothetical protein [Streptococcus sanguinis]EGD28882.1 hypothetical protein HMPREF9381_1855 [Streptococcus sanguinis SK72]